MTRSRRIRIPIKVTTRLRVTRTHRITTQTQSIPTRFVDADCPECGAQLPIGDRQLAVCPNCSETPAED